MIAANFAAFSNNAGRFHRNIVTVPQVADNDNLNPYTMLTRSRRKSGEVHVSKSPPSLNAAAKPFFITNRTLKSKSFGLNFGSMKQENTRQLR